LLVSQINVGMGVVPIQVLNQFPKPELYLFLLYIDSDRKLQFSVILGQYHIGSKRTSNILADNDELKHSFFIRMHYL
jgi:hypothetical protein